MIKIKCYVCDKEFEAKRKSAKYCCKKCSRKAENNTERAKNARKLYYQKNKGKVLKRSKEKRDNYDENKKQKIKKQRHIYYLKNKSNILDNNKKWKVQNEEKYKIYCKEYTKKYNLTEEGKKNNTLRRYKRRMLVNELDNIDYNLLKEKFAKLGNKCIICGNKDITIDHIIPVSKGGTNDIDNLQPLCKSCNSSKGNKTMEDFLNYLERKKKYEKQLRNNI